LREERVDSSPISSRLRERKGSSFSSQPTLLSLHPLSSLLHHPDTLSHSPTRTTHITANSRTSASGFPPGPSLPPCGSLRRPSDPSYRCALSSSLFGRTALTLLCEPTGLNESWCVVRGSHQLVVDLAGERSQKGGHDLKLTLLSSSLAVVAVTQSLTLPVTPSLPFKSTRQLRHSSSVAVTVPFSSTSTASYSHHVLHRRLRSPPLSALSSFSPTNAHNQPSKKEEHPPLTTATHLTSPKQHYSTILSSTRTLNHNTTKPLSAIPPHSPGNQAATLRSPTRIRPFATSPPTLNPKSPRRLLLETTTAPHSPSFLLRLA
jgi:hypothetical protein